MAATIGRTIQSVRPFVNEIAVLDNGSTDGTLDLVDQLAAEPGAPIVLDRIDGFNMGKARSANTAMASSDWVLTIDADEVLTEGEHLGTVVERAISEEAGGVAISRVLGGGIVQPTDGRLIDRRQGAWRGWVDERWTTQARFLFLEDAPTTRTSPAIKHLRDREDPARWEARALEACSDPDGYDTPYAFHLLAMIRIGQGRWEEALELLRRFVDEWADRDGRFNQLHVGALFFIIVGCDMKVWPRRREQARETARELAEYLEAYEEEHGLDVPASWLEPIKRVVRMAK